MVPERVLLNRDSWPVFFDPFGSPGPFCHIMTSDLGLGQITHLRGVKRAGYVLVEITTIVVF